MNKEKYIFVIYFYYLYLFVYISECSHASPIEEGGSIWQKTNPIILMSPELRPLHEGNETPPPEDLPFQEASPSALFTPLQKNYLRILGLSEEYEDRKDFMERSPLTWTHKKSHSFELEGIIRDALASRNNYSLFVSSNSGEIMLRFHLIRGPANFSLRNWRDPCTAASIISQISFLIKIGF